LDKLLEDIQSVSKQKAKAGMKQLGYGVISAERKFDLVAPKFVLVGQEVKATLIVTTTGGERVAMPRDQLDVRLEGTDVDFTVEDNEDGTWIIKFTPEEHLDSVRLLIATYGQEQYDWEIQLCGVPVPSQCEAVTEKQYKVNQRGEMNLIARDSKGRQLRVGGAKFALSFAGAGQLNDVGLLDKMDGSYNLTFVPNNVGQYALFIVLDGVEISGSPVNFTVVR